MKSTTRAAHLDELADWIDTTYTGTKDFNIVAKIATDQERIRWAEEVLNSNWKKPEFKKLLENVDAPKKANGEDRLIALRQAFVILAEGHKYKERVEVYFLSLSSRKSFNSMTQGMVVAV
ncbi:MAG TPA: hypothetical protein VIM37_01350 [Candidatus Microsaccharimonas sp.]|jgi:hypothetical protein